MGIDHQDSMRVCQQFARGIWDHHQSRNSNSKECSYNTSMPTTSASIDCDPSLSLGYYKRMRPLAPKIPVAPGGRGGGAADHVPTDRPITSFDLKSFIRLDSGPRKLSPSSFPDEKIKHLPAQAETHPGGGTRWNPTQEQIGILETLYKEGMRTPNAHQIEHITARLRNYGKIEGKNVFYWFQNHKARERQKQKRNILGLTHHHIPKNSPVAVAVAANPLIFDSKADVKGQEEQQTPTKRKCGRRSFQIISEENSVIVAAGITTSPRSSTDHDQAEMKTLELFPLHPDGK